MAKILGIILIILITIEAIFLDRHSYFSEYSIDAIPGFYALLGAGAALLCLLLSKLIGKLLTKKETYYDESTF